MRAPGRKSRQQRDVHRRAFLVRQSVRIHSIQTRNFTLFRTLFVTQLSRAIEARATATATAIFEFPYACTWPDRAFRGIDIARAIASWSF